MSKERAQTLATNRVLARAIEALHDKFDKALIAEWDIRGDSAKIRNAMQPLRNRCRTCKKPVAGIGDICECRKKTEYERCFSNPRDILLDLLHQRCQSVLGSESLSKFVDQITAIGVANGHDLNWIEDQIHQLRPSLSQTCRKWMLGICPPSFSGTGLLPAWLRKDGVILEEELHRTLSSGDSEAEFDLIEAQTAHHFDEAERAALDQASIQIVQALRPVPARVPRVRARQDIIPAIIAKIKRDNPDQPIERICHLLDLMKCPLREPDRRAGFSSWHDLWEDPKHRNRIKRFISAIKPAAAERKV